MSNLSWLNPTPHATAVYASCSALLPPHATLASRRPATALPGPDSHRLIAPALAGAVVRGDGNRFMSRPSSRPEARGLLGCQTASELGAPVASSIPEQLPGHEPASARKGYEDGNALVLRCRCVERSFGRDSVARAAMLVGR